MKRILPLLALFAIVSCTSETKETTVDSLSGDTITETTSEQAEIDSSKIWTYSEEVDKMTSKKKYFAQINSTNQLNFDFPYEGGSEGQIILRNKEGETEVMLSISKGQFTCGIDECSVTVRFDENPAMTFTAGGTSDGSSDILFLYPAKKFVANAIKAKKMIVQAEFYQEGLREMEFDIADLKWEH